MHLQEIEDKISKLYETVFVSTGFYTKEYLTEEELQSFCELADTLQGDLSVFTLQGMHLDPVIKKKLEEVISFVCQPS